MTAPAQTLVALTTSAALGGAETSLLTLLTALRRLEPSWRIAIVAPAGGPLLERGRALGIDSVVLPYPEALSMLGESGATGATRRSENQVKLVGHALSAALALPSYVRALGRTLRELGATIVHTNGLKAHVSAALARPPGTRLVWHLHEYVRSRPLSSRLLRLAVRRADVLVANSDSVLDDARQTFGRRARVRRIYNAVDMSIFTPAGTPLNLAALAGLPPDDGLVRVGLVAAFGRWKGHDVFIDALARLRDCPALRGYIVGGPVYETAGSQWSMEELRRRVSERHLDGMVGFTGHVADVPGAIRALDVVVHASTQREPFGMVIAEGMASGRAVIAVRAGGAAELFDDRVDALGVSADDPAGLADRIRELAGDPAMRASLGCAARRSAGERFSPGRMAAEFREAYLG
jgi:glycosyltransferase involved in cell wall biosynthesis